MIMMIKCFSGLSEYVLPSIDPIKIPYLEIEKGSGNISLNVDIKNLNIYGFNKLIINSVRYVMYVHT